MKSFSKILAANALLCFFFFFVEEVKSSAFSEDEETMTQWKLEPFGIRLSPTPTELDNIDTDIRQILQTTLYTYLDEQIPSFEYILLANVLSSSWEGGQRRRMLDDFESSTSIVFSGGVVSFKDEPTVDIDSLIQEAVNTRLPKVLHDQPLASLSSIRDASYISMVPTSAPSDMEPFTVQEVKTEDYSTHDDENRWKASRIFGLVLGCSLAVLSIALLVTKHKRNTSLPTIDDPEEKPIDDVATVVEEDVMTENGDIASERAQYAPGELLDSVSVASEWTISTNEESKPAKNFSESWAASETFERDRKITIQKDMLQSEWSNVPRRQMLPPQYWASGSNNSMSFEQAHGGQGEEIYLMPPTKTQQTGEI